MRPIDALCELVDNSVDSFSSERFKQDSTETNAVTIYLPKAAEIARGKGAISVLDNGPGLSLESAQNALRAGFSSNNPFDRLGLFGMGFNISTGKLGRKTVFKTAQIESGQMLVVEIDLEEMVQNRSYDVPIRVVAKDPPGFHGTLVEVSQWWPSGNPNNGFAEKLVRLGISEIREQLGRRYASILRSGDIRLFVNEELAEAFEHCIWGPRRFVTHREFGNLPAVTNFDKVLASQVRCGHCFSLVEGKKCPQCGAPDEFRTIQERVSGWVGIQRYDDANHYGIDLIRNGRAIRVLEKEAFFTWVDARGRQVRDYPIDSPYGRIVGEVHLDFVPTDFLKQDFQRTSPEWTRAVTFLRGESSFQPKLAAEAGEPKNESPLYHLYQGYRRVRDVGSRDVYMGYWEPGDDRAKRVSREKEQELLQRFRKKEPGFYDDSEWWKLVEQADQKPIAELKECPECGFQSLPTAESCNGCGYVFTGKACINSECNSQIVRSAVTCPTCGVPQEIKTQDRWRCSYCSRENPPSASSCLNCGRTAGEINPLSFDFLSKNSNKDDDLSIPAFSISLPDSASCPPIDVSVYTLKSGITLQRDGVALPSVAHREGGLKIFIEPTHPLFTEYQLRPEHVVSAEIAKFLQDANGRFLTGDKAHLWSLSALGWRVTASFWRDRLSIDPERTRKRAEEFFDRLRDVLPDLMEGVSSEFYKSLPPLDQGALVRTIIQNGFDASQLPHLIDSGKYLGFLSHTLTGLVVERYPERFFDGNFWSDSFRKLPVDDPATVTQIQGVVLARYRNLLDDVVGFLETRQSDTGFVVRVERTLHLLFRNIRLGR
jgi:Histidine kinase-, DNA gyrase B-, and HSP90-like ATPase